MQRACLPLDLYNQKKKKGNMDASKAYKYLMINSAKAFDAPLFPTCQLKRNEIPCSL